MERLETLTSCYYETQTQFDGFEDRAAQEHEVIFGDMNHRVEMNYMEAVQHANAG